LRALHHRFAHGDSEIGRGNGLRDAGANFAGMARSTARR